VELLRDILARYLDRSGLSRHLQHAELQRAWCEMLGEAAEHTRLDAVRKDVVTFVVDNAALLAELNNFRKAELLAGLQAQVKGLFVRELRFRPGSAKARR
jgi:predicted nucleic acid-binding Zn ribbon protein